MTIRLDDKAFTLDRLAPPWKAKDETYLRYVFAQVRKTQLRQQKVCTPRIDGLADLLTRFCEPAGKSVLCVGCRNRGELEIVASKGFAHVVGIDLASPDPLIQPMDMHQLRFPDGMFDAVFSCHSLEHAYDLKQVLKEWRRVTVPKGYWAIEVPIRFDVTAVDRHDLGSAEGLVQALHPVTIYHQEESVTMTAARVVVQV